MKKYSNTTTYNRAIHDTAHNYLMLSYNFLDDERLNVVEIGIMILILKKSDDYILNSLFLKKQCGIGDDRFHKAIKNLQNYGYLIKKNKQGSTDWIVNEIGLTIKENTNSENTSCDSTILLNTNYT
jgi:hypothetical protein